MRVISFNTQGIEQATDKGLFTWLADQDADELDSIILAGIYLQ